MPIDTCSGMYAKPSSSIFGCTMPGPHVVRDAVARHVAVRAGRAVAGDRAEHDARVDLAQLLEAEPAAFEPAGAHRLDDRVGVAHELEERVAARVGAQVEHDALLAPADVQEEERDAFDDRPRHPAPVVALRRLDLDDVGAEVGEMRGEVARARASTLRRCAGRRAEQVVRWSRPGKLVAATADAVSRHFSPSRSRSWLSAV